MCDTHTHTHAHTIRVSSGCWHTYLLPFLQTGEPTHDPNKHYFTWSDCGFVATQGGVKGLQLWVGDTDFMLVLLLINYCIIFHTNINCYCFSSFSVRHGLMVSEMMFEMLLCLWELRLPDSWRTWECLTVCSHILLSCFECWKSLNLHIDSQS